MFLLHLNIPSNHFPVFGRYASDEHIFKSVDQILEIAIELAAIEIK